MLPRERERVRVVAAVRAKEPALALLVELVVDGEVPEVEERVAHACVLPVDDPRAAAVVDEVRVQEVVVTRARVSEGAPPLDHIGDRFGPVVRGGNPDAPLPRGRPVDLDDAEAVEAGRERRPGVEARERGANLLDVDPPDLALDEARDEVALGLHEAHDLRCEAEFRGDPGRCVLGAAVDPEELGVLAADPQDEALAVDRDLEVPVRDAAAERLEPCVAPRPETGDDGLGLHSGDATRTRVRKGFEMNPSASTGRFRRTHGLSPRVLMVGAAEAAP